MVFSHDRLVVYQHAIEFVAWSRTLLNSADVSRGKDALERIVSMLVKLVQSTDAQGGREGGRRRARTADDDNA